MNQPKKLNFLLQNTQQKINVISMNIYQAKETITKYTNLKNWINMRNNGKDKSKLKLKTKKETKSKSTTYHEQLQVEYPSKEGACA